MAWRPRLPCLLTSLLVLPLLRAGADSLPSVAVVAVHRPAELYGNYPGFFSTFSGWPLPKGDLVVRAPKEQWGCDPYPADFSHPGGFSLGAATGVVSVVLRGNCTFVQKALMAQEAGAKGIIIVSDSQSVQIMGSGNGTADNSTGVDIFVIGMAQKVGERIRNTTLAAEEEGKDLVAMSITPYQSSLMNVSEAVLILLAAALVALGAFFSTADLDVHEPGSFSTALAAPQEEVLEVDHWMAVGFCAVGSCFLMFLFFFMKYMIYVIIGAFCLGGASCIAQFGAICINHFLPPMRNKAWNVPHVGPVAYAEVIAAVPAIILVICWVVLRNTAYGWPFQDIIGAGFLCFLQRTLRLPNLKLASLLLSAMFFFDIFWVFISPIFFHESVMVRVATGGGTGESVPMLLRIPTLGDPFGSDRLLGFGDIALPGLLVSYLRRHDLLSRRPCSRGYFLPALVGYFVGLNVTVLALILMRMGQPALLYLVPGTLGTTLLLSSWRGELHLLWEGIPARAQAPTAIEDSGDESLEGSGEYTKSSP